MTVTARPRRRAIKPRRQCCRIAEVDVGWRIFCILLGMAFQFRQDESVSRGLRRLARNQLQSAASALESPANDKNAAIHDARRAVKKARAVLKVIAERDRADLRANRKRLRKVSRCLAPFRDADASVEVLQHLRSRAADALPEHTYGVVRRALIEDRDRLMRDEDSLQQCLYGVFANPAGP
jgi:hypothetical protein